MSDLDAKLRQQTKAKVLFGWPIMIAVAILVSVVIAFIMLSKGYRFEVNPSAATPVSFTKKSGVGLFIGDKFYTLSSGVVIDVSAPKFKPTTITLADNSPANVLVELEPLPATISLHTLPKIENLTWLLDGVIKHKGTEYTVDLEPGNYTFTAQSPYHKSTSVAIDAGIGETIERELILEPIQGRLVIKSTPIGAEVSVNGEAIGHTPVDVSVEGGEYRISLTAQGYEVFTDNVAVSTRLPNISRNYPLLPLQAKLSVSVMPKGGSLLLNGAPITSPISVDADTPHTLTYQQAGYVSDTRAVTLAPGEQRAVQINLQPAMGKVSFSANQPAQVTVDGKLLGMTPLRTELQTLPTKVTFSREGFRSIAKTFTPNMRSITNVEATLLTEFAARRAEGQPLFATQLGIDMVAIEGESFTMGSEPNEPFRQRHEHQVKVKFTKPYWLSSKEITEAQFARFKPGTPATNLPVTNVTWLEAAMFCNWLSEQEGLPPFYNLMNGTVNKDAAGYRLPSEAEWEFAAAKYLQYTKFTYFWGNSSRLPKEQGNFADASLAGKQTFVFKDYNDNHAGKAPVGSFKVRSKLYDMDGNVAEWVHDKYNVMPPRLDLVYNDYLGTEAGAGNVIKGGSFKTGRLQNLRNAFRQQGLGAQDDVGFRIARYEAN